MSLFKEEHWNFKLFGVVFQSVEKDFSPKFIFRKTQHYSYAQMWITYTLFIPFLKRTIRIWKSFNLDKQKLRS